MSNIFESVMIKVLLGYLMPIWFMVFGVISEGLLNITNPAYYATIAYVMGVIQVFVIYNTEH